MKIKIILIGSIILLCLPRTQAQVTIGSDVPPRKGVLLDLKENDKKAKNPNSDKGLGFPLVTLSSLKKLTIDDDSEKDNYAGVMVYNTTANAELSPGTYCWFGDTWKQVVLVDNGGTDGNMLKSNGDYTYSWTTIKIPEYKFWKPTQKAFFDPDKAKSGSYTYNYEDIVSTNDKPKPGIFTNRFVYTDKLNINSDAASGKFLLLGITANVTKRTSDNAPAAWSFKENMQVDILIDDRVVKTYTRASANPIMTVTNSIIDLFSAIPLDEFKFGKGEYPIQVRISCINHTYARNRISANPAGNFKESGPFLDITAINFGFILYEEE